MGQSKKLLSAGFAAWVARRPSGLKLKGTPEEISVIKEALVASRNFRDEMCKEGASIEVVLEKLSEKHKAAHKFEQVMGYTWPL